MTLGTSVLRLQRTVRGTCLCPYGQLIEWRSATWGIMRRIFVGFIRRHVKDKPVLPRLELNVRKGNAAPRASSWESSQSFLRFRRAT